MDGAWRWYEGKSTGLGDRFVQEIDAALVRIVEHPNAWTPLSRSLRRHRLNSFPYSLIYAHRNESILIVAVAHQHRRVGYWRKRLDR